MEDFMVGVQRILEEAPTRAMSFSHLLEALKETGFSVRGREDWILERMMTQPGVFKVIPDRLGPWIEGLSPPGAVAGFTRGRRSSDPWIMLRGASSASLGVQGRVVGRIRESLQAWGNEIDEGSQLAVARWIGANREAEQAVGKLLTVEGERR